MRPLAEVVVTGRAKGVADAAGLLKPKLKPEVAADVVAGAPDTETKPHFTESGQAHRTDSKLSL